MAKESMIEGVNDSKKISEKKREKIYEEIVQEAIAYGVGIIDQEEIDKINILNATKKGLTIAIRQMEEKLEEKNIKKPDVILVDALTGIDTLGIPYKSIIHGDAISYSIACASIIAKVTRDRIMRKMDEMYPQYGFAKHKGYGTAAHMQAIRENGLCPLHRRSFVKNII
jgi:ribonuclease HII